MIVVRTCSGCGTPKAIIRRFQWKDNGLMELKSGGVRSSWIEVGAYTAIYEGIEERLGISIEKIITDAMNHWAKLYVDGVLSGLQGKLIRLRPFRVLADYWIFREGRIFGHSGNGKMIKHKSGELAAFRLEGAAVPVIMAGESLGCFRSIEGVNAEVDFGKVGDAYYFEQKATPDIPTNERLHLEIETVVDAQVS